jgi:phosphatidylglycerol---prolipoprotein diacylglyceryl transferase
MLPFLRIGPFLFQMSGLALLAGLWAATTLIEKEALRLKLNTTAIFNMIFYGLIGGLIGARLTYAFQHLNAYMASPISLFSLNTSTLNSLGGFVTGLVIADLFGRQKLPLRPTLDAVAPGLAVIMIAIGVANFLSGNGYGSPTRLPWAIYLWGEYRHPTQIYETVAALIVFLIWKMDLVSSPGAGTRFLQIVSLLASTRIFLEAFHGDSLVWPGGFRAVQVLGLMILAISIYPTRQWEKADAQVDRPSLKDALV